MEREPYVLLIVLLITRSKSDSFLSTIAFNERGKAEFVNSIKRRKNTFAHDMNDSFCTAKAFYFLKDENGNLTNSKTIGFEVGDRRNSHVVILYFFDLVK